MKPSTVALLLLMASCDRGAGASLPRGDGTSTTSCVQDSECPDDHWCLHHLCTPRSSQDAMPGDVSPPAATLIASPRTLSFGSVAQGESRTLALVLANVGDSMLTVSELQIAPADAPFALEPTGYGPFWIRPGRSRELFLTFSPASSAPTSAFLTVTSEASPVQVELRGN